MWWINLQAMVFKNPRYPLCCTVSEISSTHHTKPLNGLIISFWSGEILKLCRSARSQYWLVKAHYRQKFLLFVSWGITLVVNSTFLSQDARQRLHSWLVFSVFIFTMPFHYAILENKDKKRETCCKNMSLLNHNKSYSTFMRILIEYKVPEISYNFSFCAGLVTLVWSSFMHIPACCWPWASHCSKKCSVFSPVPQIPHICSLLFLLHAHQ